MMVMFYSSNNNHPRTQYKATRSYSFYTTPLTSEFFFSNSVESLAGRRVALFSYGSGLAATMFSLRVSQDVGPDSLLSQLVASLEDLQQRLDLRLKVSPSEFADAMKLREDTHHKGKYIFLVECICSSMCSCSSLCSWLSDFLLISGFLGL